MSAFIVPSIFTAKDKFSAPVRKMTTNVQRFAQKADVGVARAERSFRRLVSPLSRIKSLLGGFGLFIGGAAIVAGIASSVQVFRDFEQANANLASVMATATRPELISLQTDAKRLGATTAKTASEVVGLQEAFARLGFTTPQIINMTEATIAGSIAMRGELADTAELVGALVNTFDKFSSIDAAEILDQLTVATQSSALNFEKLQTGLPIVAGAANAAGIPFTRLIALLGKLSDAGIDTSSSSTALRNIFIESAKQGLTYSQILTKIEKSQDKLTSATDEFGKRAAVPASILSKNIRATEILDKKLRSAAKGQLLSGAASKAAAKQLDTLNGSLTILNSAWEGFILSGEDGTGTLAMFLKQTVRVATEVLSLASGTAKATGDLKAMERWTRRLAERSIFWIKTIKNVVFAFVAMRTALFIASAFIFGYNVALGVSMALSGKAAFALRGNTIALGAYAFISRIATGVQWALNAAMAANPIGLIIVGIIALIALITVIVAKWNEWGAAIALFLGPIGLVISLIMSLRRNWEALKDAFTVGGLLEGFKKIGTVILDSILMPLQQVFTLLANIAGPFGDVASTIADKILSFRERIGANITTDESGEVLPVNIPASGQEAVRVERQETSSTQNVKINIADNTGRATVDSDDGLVEVLLQRTFDFGG